MRIVTQVLLTTLCLLISASESKAQTIAHSFDGDTGPGLAVCQTGITHCGWPDMDAAVNGKQVAQVTWQNFRVYDYSGDYSGDYNGDYSGRLVKSIPMTPSI